MTTKLDINDVTHQSPAVMTPQPLESRDYWHVADDALPLKDGPYLVTSRGEYADFVHELWWEDGRWLNMPMGEPWRESVIAWIAMPRAYRAPRAEGRMIIEGEVKGMTDE